jgi:hypothetical protein
MGIRDWFRRSEAQAPPPTAPPGEERFHLDRSRMFDLGKTAELGALFAVDGGRRDSAWIERFFDAAWCGSVALAEPQTFTGPDGFPYLRLDLPRPHTGFDSQCLANLAGDCIKNRVGAAFFASPDDPPESAQYVLSLGLIDSLLRYDSPFGDAIDVAEADQPPDDAAFSVEKEGGRQTMIVEETHQVMMGTPSADYLPPHLAHSLYLHLTQRWGMENPTVALIADMKMRPHRSLVVGRKRSEFPPDATVDALAQKLIWHLNPGRMVMLMSEDWSPGQMTPLRNLFEGR